MATPPSQVDPLAETVKMERESVVLFGTRLSPFVEKVVRALCLKRIPFDLVEAKSPSDFAKWNPQTRKMPSAEIGGERVIDSTFILRRLEAVKPDPALFAKDPAAAASQRLLEDWADESLYWLRMAILWSEPRRATDAILSTLPIPRLFHPLMRPILTRQIGGQTKAQGFGRLPASVLVRELGMRCDDLVALLGSREFFFGEQPSAGDLTVFAMLHFEGVPTPPEFDRVLSERPTLSAWKERVGNATVG
jgi:glutathione S-transferase